MSITGDVIAITCIVCGVAFETMRTTRGRLPRFCSAECRRRRRAAQHRTYRVQGRYPRNYRRERPLLQKTCVVCGKGFSTTNLRTRCCGVDCGLKLSHRLSSVTRKERRAERDARVCQQCGIGFVARNPSGKARRGEACEGRFCSRRCAAAAATKRPAVQLKLFGPSQPKLISKTGERKP